MYSYWNLLPGSEFCLPLFLSSIFSSRVRCIYVIMTEFLSDANNKSRVPHQFVVVMYLTHEEEIEFSEAELSELSHTLPRSESK